MTKFSEPTLVEFALYNQWANQQLLNICISLEENMLDANIPGTIGSILETFSHILRAEVGFLNRIQGTSPQPSFDWEENPSLEEIAAFADEVVKALIEMVKQVSPTENVHEENSEWTFDYQARLIFMSIVYHGISHRTDITTFLNSQGVELPELDIWGYQETYPQRFEAELKKKG